MADLEPIAQKSFGEKLTSFPKYWLYATLMIIASISLVPQLELPVKPGKATVDLYANLMSLPEGSTIIIQSDWTNSSRGESAGAFEALLRILMRKNVKIALMSVADPSAPRIARDALARINKERKGNGEREYQKWEDYVELGYFPNAEATGNAMRTNLRNAWANIKDAGPNGQTDVFQSPVLKDIRKIENTGMMICVTASDSITRLIERIGKSTKLAALVTGVMGPETMVYYSSGQLTGVSVGLNGVVELEALCKRGIDPDISDKEAHDLKNPIQAAKGRPNIEGFTGTDGKEPVTYARGMQYYLSLHAALALLIIAVVLGNIGTFLSRRRAE